MNNTILFAYHPENSIKGTLHKYGDYKNIFRLYQKWREIFIENNLEKLADELILVENVSDADLEKMVDITGYVGVWYESTILQKNNNNEDDHNI